MTKISKSDPIFVDALYFVPSGHIPDTSAEEIHAIIVNNGGSVHEKGTVTTFFNTTGGFHDRDDARKAVTELGGAGCKINVYMHDLDESLDLDDDEDFADDLLGAEVDISDTDVNAGQIALPALHDDPDETSLGWHGGQCNLLYELAHDVRRTTALLGIAKTESDTICRVRIDPDAMCLLDGEITLLVTDNGGAVDYRGPDFLVAVFPSQACAETVITVLRRQGMTATLCDENFDGNDDYEVGWRRGVAALLYDIAHDDRRANALLQYAEAVEASAATT